MKNLNLIKRLWTDSHEKQTPQRFARYAAILIMLLTLGVGQMWASKIVYFVNKDSWSTPKCHHWQSSNSGNSTSWPGDTMVDTGNKLGSYKIFSCTISDDSHDRCIFSNNGSNQTGDLTIPSDAGNRYYYNGNWLVTFTEDAVVYFTMSPWWTNHSGSGCYHNLTTNGPSGTSSKIKVYQLQSYLNDNSATLNNTTKAESNIVMFATIPAGTYSDYTMYRGSSDASNWNTAGSNTFSSSSNKDNTTRTDGGSHSSWTTYQATSTASLAATSTSITTAQTSTLTPSLTSNTRLNKIKSTSYSVTNNPGSAGSVTSEGVFSATAAGSYTVTATVTYNAKGFPSITKKATATKNITVTSASTATLTYHANYAASGTGNVPSSVDVPIDETTTVAGNTGSLAMDKYTFAGWNTSPYIDGTHYDAGEDIEMTDDIDLYATWTYTVTLNQNGATTSGSTSFVGTWNCSTIPAITNPSRTGYNFVYWNTEAGGGGSDVINPSGVLQASKYNWTDGSGRFQRNPGSQNKPLYAKWTQDITLNANTDNHGSGSNKTGTVIWNGTSITISTHCSPASGYSLDGYYTAATGGTKIINADKSFAGSNITVSGDPYISSGKWVHPGATTLYAQYTPIQYTISFNKQSGSSGTNSATVHFNNNDFSVSPVVAPTRTGYTFGGYYTSTGGSGEQIVNASGVWQNSKTNYLDGSGNWIYAGNKTLYAKWTEVLTTVTINVSPASTGTLTVGGEAFTPGNTTTAGVSTSRSVVATAANDYAFSSWSVSGNATGTNSTNTYTLKGNGSGNTGTLTANFTLIPVKLYKLSKAKNGDITDKGTMSYDPSSSAYYMDITTDASPYYFRFYHNGSTQYCSDWKDKWEGGYTSGKEVVANGSKVDCDKAVSGWDDKPGMYYTGASGSGIRIWFDYQNKKAWITETGYDVTVYDGDHGTVSPNGTVNVGGAGVSLTATPSTGYHFTSWSKGGTVANISLSSTTTNPTTLTATGTGGTVTANYAANTYRVQFHRNGGEGDVVYQDFTYDVAQNLTANTYTRTGYNFAGWALSSGGSVTYADGAEVSNLIATNNATFHLYAKWTAKQSSITLDQTGYGTAGSTTTRTGTYGLAMPAITGANTLPVAQTGYKFMGYYDNLSPLGTKYYNADGTSAHSWDKDTEDPTTLYAYYKAAEITNLRVAPSTIEPEGTVVATPTISPTPTGDAKICWRVLYSNDNPLETQPDFSQGPNNAVIFTAPDYSGTFKVEAKLYNDPDCEEGSLLSTNVTSFQVAGLHTVNVRYKCGDEVIQASTNLEGIRPLTWSEEISAPEIFGYIFAGWTAGDGVSLTDDDGTTTKTTTTESDIKIKAIYDGYMTATYTKRDYIYFKNTMGWSNVYVYFYTSDLYWDGTEYGSGANKDHKFKKGDDEDHKPYWDEKHGTLEHLDGTDIWYFDAGAIGCADWTNIVFNANDQHGYDWFSATEVVRRGDFKKKTPMYVPADKATYDATLKNTNAYYYSQGYWVNYIGEHTGYTLEVYDDAGSSLLRSVKFTSVDKLMPMTATLDLEAGTIYKFRLKRDGNTDGDVYYGNTGSMTYAHRYGQGTPWAFTSGTGKCELTTTAAGDYVFHLTYSQNGSGEYDLRIAVEHPIKNGDYRLVYSDNKPTCKPSAIVPKVNNGKDTVSFFIRPSNSPALKIQTASVNASTGAITWGSDVNVTSSLSSLTKDSVYNICLTMNGSGAISVESVEAYTGNYYIRTDVANSKWDNWTSDPDHLMTYSEYSITHGGYSHYYCHWVKSDEAGRKNVKFCIANDYSPCISDTLIRESNAAAPWTNINNYIDANGNILRNANVRFMWNQSTNVISRAYVDGAQGTGSNNFLYILSEDGKITKSDGSALDASKVNFSDNGNWVYEANLKVEPNAEVKLLSNWGTENIIRQYFKGTSSKTEKLIGGSGTDPYDIRVIYDYKTNRLISSWVPSSADITDNKEIEADVMFIREHHGDIAQLTFGDNGKISEIKTAYGVLRLLKNTLNNKDENGDPLPTLASIYERSLYWISFPFRVKLSEVLAFGAYGTHWAVQRYDGAGRAAKGHFLENGSFWKWMDRNTEYLEPNQGYLLAVDLDLLGEESDVWGPDSRSSQLEIYFPSYGTMPDITNADVEQTITPHVCEINRAATEGLPDTGNPRTSYNRTIFDSHWNVMSVPTYVNTYDVSFANDTWTNTIGPNFLYTWNQDDNTITATSASGYKYHAMHAYMVQYGGTVKWSASSGSPASIVARRTYAEKPSKVEFRLELQQNEKMIDRTYVALSSDEDVSSEFRFGEDMTKEFNANKANIYTKIDYLGVAGNTLPMSEQTTVVPVGVEIKTNGDYTFTIPDGTEGIGVTLVDNESGVRTNLGLTDYVVTLSKGDYVDRFALEISPIKQMPTDIENADASVHDAVRKVVVDGILYIVKEGVVYDARGNRVK